MATKLNVNGKFVIRPGVYAYIKSGIKNAPLNLSYGNVVIIDDGIGAGFGGGSGVNGEFQQGKGSVYNFTSIQDYQNFVKGGELWNIGQPLFKPLLNNILVNGVSKLTLIRACTTTGATMTYTLTNGSFEIKTKDEGLNANGVLVSGNLSQGYGATLTASPRTAGKYILSIYHGTFKGIDPLNNAPYDTIAANVAQPQLVSQSPEVYSISELVTWMQADKIFNQGFVLVSSTINPTTTTTTTTSTTTSTTTTSTTTIAIPPGAITPGDVTANLGYKLAIGGTESYGSGDFDAALAAVKDVDNTFFLCSQYGDDAIGINNTKIFSFVTSGESKFEKMIVVGGGYDKGDYTSTTVGAAHYFDSDHAIVVHGGAKKTSRAIGGYTLYSQFHKAANVVGRLAGLEPQVPLTFKALDYDAEVHVLDNDELDYALENGILVSYYDDELAAIVVLQDINTLQNNEFLINEDNTSFSIQIKRIEFQLNKEIIVNAKKVFFGSQTQGPNRNTISGDAIKQWLGGYLTSRTASANKDDLILQWRNIVVTYDQDNVIVNYEFSPNSEVSKILFIGTMFLV